MSFVRFCYICLVIPGFLTHGPTLLGPRVFDVLPVSLLFRYWRCVVWSARNRLFHRFLVFSFKMNKSGPPYDSRCSSMQVRNTIMKENDLCERLRFEEKQLRQYLRTLKQDQLIKSKLQLETDTSGKTTKITHYFIEYKVSPFHDLFTPVVFNSYSSLPLSCMGPISLSYCLTDIL